MGESEERYAYLKYVGHIAMMTGRVREAIRIDGIDSISDLLSRLEEKYPGFKEIFLPSGGVFNSRTGIILRRVSQAGPVIDRDQKIETGDMITFW
jgi:hypothetical protein